MAMMDTYLRECLFFTSSRLQRIVTKIVDEEFARCGLPANGAFLLLAVLEEEGINQKKLGETLHLQPSTVTRLIEKLVLKGVITSRVEGRSSLIYSTDKGKALEPIIHDCWDRLRVFVNEVLGEEESNALTLRLDRVSEQLEKAD
ncbi:MarR family winged helix-turn-helix transcriptional regulator [Cohnella sp. GCM10027633]|uniref:MarR family winged helix-turn-helix transcriptional regulator n=1 Tax=unclassified Cohnella TaxID=2636738 RepID=UPI0036279563